MIKDLLAAPGLVWLKGVSTKSVYRDVCKRYDLVYFGTIDRRRDEYEMVRGMTHSASHSDSHYCVGTISGRDVIFVYRTDTVRYPQKPSRNFSWHILQLDLKGVSLPHALLDAHHRDETFYADLFTKFARLNKVHPSVFDGHEKAFVDHHAVYTPPDTIDSMPELLPLSTTSIIGHNFHSFDYEFFQDRLIVYALEQQATKNLLDQMIKAGLWLANELEHNGSLAGYGTISDIADAN